MSGRPTLYTAEIVERLLAELTSGRSLRAVCNDEGMPPRGTVLQWVHDDREGFAARYRRACEIGDAPYGSPTVYNEVIADTILEELGTGRSLASVCRDPGMPASATVRLWVVQDREGFASRYQFAREFGCDILADQIVDIADDPNRELIARRRKDGSIEYVPDPQDLRRRRLRIGVRKWRLSKMLPVVQRDQPPQWPSRGPNGKTRKPPRRRLKKERG